MIRHLIRKHSTLVQLCLCMLGILTIITGNSLIENRTLLAPIQAVGVAFVVASLVAIFQDLFEIDIPSQIEQRLNLSGQLREMGLTSVHPCIGDESIFFKFEDARSIDLMYNTAKNTTYRYMNRIKHAIVEQGCAVRILVSDPKNPALQIKQVYDGLCPGTNIVNEVHDVTERISILVDELKNRIPSLRAGSIEIRYFQCAPTGSLVIVDKEMARFTPYIPYAHSSDVPSFDATGVRRGKLVQIYNEAFERIWEKSQPALRCNFSPALSESYISLRLNHPQLPEGEKQ
jgi:hypothetical protein